MTTCVHKVSWKYIVMLHFLSKQLLAYGDIRNHVYCICISLYKYFHIHESLFTGIFFQLKQVYNKIDGFENVTVYSFR